MSITGIKSWFSFPITRTKDGGITHYTETYPCLPWFRGLRILGIDDDGIIFRDLIAGDQLIWLWKKGLCGRWLSIRWEVSFGSLTEYREFDKNSLDEMTVLCQETKL